jgi:hypothetical protein
MRLSDWRSYIVSDSTTINRPQPGGDLKVMSARTWSMMSVAFFTRHPSAMIPTRALRSTITAHQPGPPWGDPDNDEMTLTFTR